MTLLSVLIPTYNRPHQLRQALCSVVHLGQRVEIIIGNNGKSEPVQQLLSEISLDVPVRVLENQPGSTYPDNLKALLSCAHGEWLTILHDDDFFTPEANIIAPYLAASSMVDFVFSDHYVSDQEGNLLLNASSANSDHYGRSQLQAGVVNNLQLLAVKQAICLDCFFIRTELSKKCEIDTSFLCFADILFLAQVAACAQKPSYIPDRLFAYRINNGLTSAGLPQDELLSVLLHSSAYITEPIALAALKLRIKLQARHALKYSIKRFKMKSASLSLFSLVGLRRP